MPAHLRRSRAARIAREEAEKLEASKKKPNKKEKPKPAVSDSGEDETNVSNPAESKRAKKRKKTD